MMFHILLTCSFTTLLVQSQRFSKSIQAQPKVGYSSNIVHTHPGSNNLQSESSVKVNFQTQQGVALQGGETRAVTKYLQANNNAPSNGFYSRPNVNNNPKSSNSFNVGYNISFSNNNSANKKQQRHTGVNNKKIENAEIITGKSKQNQKVRAPSVNIDMSPQEFVSHAFLTQKQINSENVKHVSLRGKADLKHLNPLREEASKFPSQSPKFTYRTQQNIFKDVIQATKPDLIQLGPEFKTSYQTGNRWKNVSPGLEISKSIEPQISEQNYRDTYSSKHTNSKRTLGERPQSFNHDSALKNSESFDFSNAHGDMLYGDNNSATDSYPEGSVQYTQRTNNYEVNADSSNRNNIDSDLNGQQFPNVNNIDIAAHIPERLRGIKPLPLDTSLLKDPVLTTDFREAPPDSRVIPIHFDISNIQRAMQEHLAQIQNYAGQQNQQPQGYGHLHQAKNAEFSSPSHSADLSYEDHEPSASQHDFRMYGNVEPIDRNHYRTGYNYERKRSSFDNDIYKIVSMRPPPVGHNVKY